MLDEMKPALGIRRGSTNAAAARNHEVEDEYDAGSQMTIMQRSGEQNFQVESRDTPEDVLISVSVARTGLRAGWHVSLEDDS
jgi:hypothetical protein